MCDQMWEKNRQRVDESEGCLLGAASEFNQLQGASFGEEVKLQFFKVWERIKE